MVSLSQSNGYNSSHTRVPVVIPVSLTAEVEDQGVGSAFPCFVLKSGLLV